MKKEYISPEVEIEMFYIRKNVFCELSTGLDDGDNDYYVDDEF